MIKTTAKLRQNLRKIEKAAQRLTGSRRQATALARKIETQLSKVAAKNFPKIVETLVADKRAGWVKGPGKNMAVLVEAKTGCLLLDSKGKQITDSRYRHPRTPPIDKGAFLQHLKGQRIERYVPYMYLDEYGNVTVGIGHLITDADKAEPLSFVKRGTNDRADKQHIRNAFNKVRVSNLTPGQAHLFENLTHIEILEPEAEKLAKEDMGMFLNILKKGSYFPDFGTYPITAKMGILDMAYTLGAFGTRTSYPRFTAAVRRRNWKLAAQHSHRPQVSGERDAIVRDWFKQAARQERFFIHPNCTKKLMSR